MRTRDCEFLNAEAQRRLQSVRERFSENARKALELGVFVPEIPPWESYAGLRRKVERLRAGKVRGLDPRIPPNALADLIEQMIEQDRFVRSVRAEMEELTEMDRDLKQRDEAEQDRRSVAVLHALKKSRQAADPGSPIAMHVRALSRERRNELGRPRKRKG